MARGRPDSAFQPDPGRLEALKARLEAETDRWSFLESQPGVPAPAPPSTTSPRRRRSTRG